MKWTGVNEVREKYLSFFESKNHLRMQSAPLVPVNDKSLLLINSGMAPLKKYFLGEVTPPNKRLTTCQKCIRTPDIENVGKTDRHGTFFEMLGNFSFGDYFKKEAIEWAWEFTIDVMGLPEDKIHVSVYEEDDEAYDLWTNHMKLPKERVVRLGKEDNFWEHGAGPSGPCSELHYDRGEEYGCDNPNCGVGCECDRYLEFWNLVFTQFDSDGKGKYTPLANPNIDTGMGLERMAAILQGVNTIFDVDTFQEVISHIESIASVKYHEVEKIDISLRVISDHIRSTVFLVGDGVLPSNEGRGYVLRRLLRRAARHGKLLNIDGEFLYKLCGTVIKSNSSGYPDLVEKQSYIEKIVKSEEERFGKTINQGMELLSNMIKKIMNEEKPVFPGGDAFKLYDTFGFPIDLTKEILEEKNITLGEEGFYKLMEKQRERARRAREEQNDSSWTSDVVSPTEIPTVFLGYAEFSSNSKIEFLMFENDVVEEVQKGQECIVILDKTPFYAESGGQVADTGYIKQKDGLIKITNCQKIGDGVFAHFGTVEKGEFKKGDNITAEIDVKKRKSIMRNHTSAHMLQAALLKVLGDHIHQAGSYVDEEKLRFDFNHFGAVTKKEIVKIEETINNAILAALTVTVKEMSIEEAKEEGAISLLGEEYGDIVRVVNIEGYSVEFCGGTHVNNTSKLGLFKITSETSIAAGVRRIEGTTGQGVLNLFSQIENNLMKAAEILKVQSRSEVINRIKSTLNEVKEKDGEIDILNNIIADNIGGNILSNIIKLNNISFATMIFENYNTETLKTAALKFTENHPNSSVLMLNMAGEKSVLISASGKNAIEKGVHAGNFVKEVAKLMGGSGGGREAFAMAGIKDTMGVEELNEKSKEIIEKMLD